MPTTKISLHAIVREIRKVEKQLRAMRSKVARADQKIIDLELRSLKRGTAILVKRCKDLTVPFGHAFKAK